ncbi:MAG TPA: T9SS type A sorting domain-containing protein [Candidatus Cloacimonadota bacterium]|nr:T9SS type A sorting domain-containing protein [Candidatus Cloacimonadota bacterium]
MKSTLFIMSLLLVILPIFATFHKIGEFETTGAASSMAISENIAYIADDIDFKVIDITNPIAPQLLGSCTTLGTGLSMEISGDLVYVAEGTSGLQIIDVSNSQSPQIIGSYPTPNSANYIAVEGNRAYLACYDTGLMIFDISNPQTPILLGSYPTEWGSGLCVIGNIVYLAGGGFTIIDATDPQNLQVLSTYQMGYARSVTVSGNRAYVNNSEYGFSIFDISNPQLPQLLGQYSPMTADVSGYAYSVKIIGNYAYLSYGPLGLQIVDISNPQSPILMKKYSTIATDAIIKDNLAYLVSYTKGIQIIDISNDTNPQLIGSLETPGNASNLAVINNAAFITDGDFSGLRVINISNPNLPQAMGQYSSMILSCMASEGNSLYLIDYNGLEIYNATNPSSLVLQGNYWCLTGINAIAVSSSIVYLADDEFGLVILDVINPASPILLSSFVYPGPVPLESRPFSIAVKSGIAYVTYANEVVTINVSDPTNPRYLGHLLITNHTSSSAIVDNMLYLAASREGLLVIDVSNPSMPVYHSTILPHSSSSIGKVYKKDNYLIIADDAWNEIGVYDVTVPATPTLNNTYAWNLSTSGMYLNNNLLYTSNFAYGMNVLDISSLVAVDDQVVPFQKMTLSNYPNPFNPSTTISFSLPSSGIVKLDIYNIRGQLVESVVNDQFTQGTHTVTWNGIDFNNKSVASGVYFAKMSCNGQETSRKLVLVK